MMGAPVVQNMLSPEQPYTLTLERLNEGRSYELW